MGGGTGIRTRKKHPDKALNVLAIRAIDKPGRYADGNGLYLKVDPSGAKRWELRTVVRGKRCDIGLGGLKAVTLAEAREQARKYRATTNSDTYLIDETGGRRFWPIRARNINLDGLRRNRDQLWAEALEYFFASTPWWIDNPDVYRAATEEQAGRYASDPWDEVIHQLAKSEEELSIGQVLSAVGVETGRRTQIDMNWVARCLKALGWTRVQVGVGRDRRWIYRKGRKEG